MTIQIKRWDNGEVIHEGEFESIKACLEDGVSKGVSFSGAELNYAELNGAKLNGAKLNGAKLNGAKLNGAELNGAELNGAELNGAELPEKSLCINAGEVYFLFVSPQVVQAGCQSHSPGEWRGMTKIQIADMDGKKALRFYPRLLDIMDFYLGKGDRPDWLEG